MDLLMRRRALMQSDAIDTDGLIGYWDAKDEILNNRWIDRINNLCISLTGNVTKTNNGIELNYLDGPGNAAGGLEDNAIGFMNNQIKQEFTCMVDCAVKFNEVGKIAPIIDFGSVGQSLSDISIAFIVNQSGSINGGFKSKRNVKTNLTDIIKTVQISTIPLDEYVPISVKLGVRLIDGVQELYAEGLGVTVTAKTISTTNVNFKGAAGFTSRVFGLGIGFISPGTSGIAYVPNYKSDTIYNKILLYNKAK